MTLLDYPGRVACTVFLSGCNFRCPFCHNSELLDGNTPGIMDDAALLKFLEGRRGILEGVAFTGGEPLMRRELPQLLAKIKELGYPIKLDTNGAFPVLLKAVVSTGLVDYVAMDIKNSPERYAETAGLEKLDLEPVRESVSLLMEGRTDYEFRTTTVAELHDAESFRGIGAWIRGAERYFLQKFTDRDTVPFGGFHAPEDDRMREYLAVAREYVPAAALRGVED